MALTTGDFAFYYGDALPEATDNASPIGGSIDLNSPATYNNTGLIPTGLSNVAGAGTNHYYAKVFARHEGAASSLLYNPQLYVRNENVSDQIYLALDPFYTGYHAASTGTADNRLTLPDGLNAGDFGQYNGDTALVVNDVATGTITMDSGDSIGFWVRVSVPAGLANSYSNNFELVLRGQV